MVIRSSFTRDFAIITGALVLAGSVTYVVWAIRGPDSLPTYLYGLGRYALGAAIIGCLASAAIRFMGRLALWKDIAACAAAAFVWAMVTGLPVEMSSRLLSALFCGVFLAGALKKGRGWLDGRASEKPQITSPS